MKAPKRSRRKQRNRSWARRMPAEGLVRAPWRLRTAEGLQVLELAPFRKLPWLVHGFSTRAGGSSARDGQEVLNLSFTDWDRAENVAQNRSRFQAAVAAEGFALLAMKQIHSDVIRLFRDVPSHLCQGDASATNCPGILLAIQTADCVPILLVDPKKRAVAAVHAGWRGTLSRIAEKTVGRMRLEFGTRPQDLLAALGPSIGPCCYEVGAEFVTKFTAQFSDAAEYFDEPRSGDEPNPLQWLNMAPPGHQPPPENVHLDLPKANRSQLLAAGLRPHSIFSSEVCTSCRLDLFFSYRKEGSQSGRLWSVVGIRDR